MKPIKLPLEASIVRCLAHGDMPGQWCERRAECAAHETIVHDGGLATAIACRKCGTDLFAAFLPLAGFPDDEESPTYTVKVLQPAWPGATTPAGGGANITGSQASESLVEGGSLQADPSAEGLAVVEQPKPVEVPVEAGSDENHGRPVWEIVIEDMKARDELGRNRYGTPLQAFNGRDQLVDAYQEALDLAVYLRAAICERDKPREAIANAAAMLDGFALELRLAHALPSKPDVIQEPEVAREYARIKRVVAELYDIAGVRA